MTTRIWSRPASSTPPRSPAPRCRTPRPSRDLSSPESAWCGRRRRRRRCPRCPGAVAWAGCTERREAVTRTGTRSGHVGSRRSSQGVDMYARNVSMHLKANTAGEFTQTFEKDVLPLLRKQNGFKDEISFVAPDRSEAVAISLWDRKENADKYGRD